MKVEQVEMSSPDYWTPKWPQINHSKEKEVFQIVK